MSFKEIKSLLRMVNVDMNDMYAYRLFKVGTSALSSPDRSSHLFSFPSSSRGDRGLLQQKGHTWVYLPSCTPPRLWDQDGRAGPELVLPLRQTPGAGRTLGLPTLPSEQ